MNVTNGIFSMMYTLIQVLTLDSWNGISRPLMKYIWWSCFFFYAYIAFAVVVLLNLVTATIVDNAMKNSRMDEQQVLAEKQRERKQLMDQFRSLFEMMDADRSGSLTVREFESAFDLPEVSTKLQMLDFEPGSCRELFALLDSGDGALSFDEFFEGMQHMEGTAKAKDSLKIMKSIESLQRPLHLLTDLIRANQESLNQHSQSKLGDTLSSQHDASFIACSKGRPQSLELTPHETKYMSLPTSSSPESYYTGLEPPPAIDDIRRKHLGGPRFDGLFENTESLTESLMRHDSLTDSTLPDQVADQVSACNAKVDNLSTSVCTLHVKMEALLRKFDTVQTPR
jgi:Ca2+-binding EF-hand superfamily protein